MALFTQTFSTIIRGRCGAILMAFGMGMLLLAGCGNKGPLYLPETAPITEIGPGERPTDATDRPEAQAPEQPEGPVPVNDGALIPNAAPPSAEDALREGPQQ